ncbi:DNA recombination protein RmuC [Agromyces sp. LHK192]|uniref:DNA recombination protein RmuC n=1 Tax=Agromyces sp. LHK192 TaxID=2498704 RepID=UPI001F0C5F01|nr:DNA recombination protein RmuC [Agromyces sp. LHK192]
MDIVSLLAGIIVGLLVGAFGIWMLLRQRPSAAGTEAGVSAAVRDEMRAANVDLRQEFGAQRTELRQVIGELQAQLDQRLQATAATQADELRRERETRQASNTELRLTVDGSLKELTDRFHASANASVAAQTELKTAVEQRFDTLRRANDEKLEQVRTTAEKLQGAMTEALGVNAERIQGLTEANSAKHVELQQSMRDELEKLRTGNEAKLEKMRETVDEKLQGTLEKRLGESFKLVSERLEQVQVGLGEMKNLATDVGGLKRVLTNVKSRGTWGEVQLSRQLEDLLTPDQYDQNVVIRPGTRENVEFAIKLPGRNDDDRPVYLPIDSKFPQEDYERLLEAQESGEKVDIESAAKALERAIIAQAKTIAEKYIEPPLSTDFAIMYLPTEGLFAEVVRRPGLMARLQNDYRVNVTGPATLASLLNSLQMGFRTLAIEKRSSEVWQVLGAAKAEFQKYGQVWDKLGKQLQTAQNTVAEAGRRTRAVERKLRGVELVELEAAEDAGALDLLLPEIEAGRSDSASEAADDPAEDLFVADIDPEIRSV